MAQALVSYPADQLVVIGDVDPFLDREAFDALPGQRLLVAGDHVLATEDDPVAMVASHDAFVRAFDSWLMTLS